MSIDGVKNPSIGSAATSSTGGMLSPSDSDAKCRRAIGRLSENLYIMGNEPSQALYCIQEHVRKEVPNMIRQKNEFTTQHRLLQGTCYDCDYAIGAVKSIDKSQDRFLSIQNYLKNALFLRQQLKYEESRRKLQQKQKK
ncbi:BLOC-1-related complex subunit 8 homolog [Folsomia candida]|uniref:BLOC-1-related complex subunit 8 homolog n=1 Tax=Folsomia candida TaxID=158441 RepID=UPI000B906A2C|nr:BLOC-1-related complex subunit 8 homolog [Folsomia candida]